MDRSWGISSECVKGMGEDLQIHKILISLTTLKDSILQNQNSNELTFGYASRDVARMVRRFYSGREMHPLDSYKYPFSMIRVVVFRC